MKTSPALRASLSLLSLSELPEFMLVESNTIRSTLVFNALVGSLEQTLEERWGEAGREDQPLQETAVAVASPVYTQSRAAVSSRNTGRKLRALASSRRCCRRRHGPDLFTGRLRSDRLRSGPHAVSVQPGGERSGEWSSWKGGRPD